MRVANIDYKKRIIESFLYNTSVYDAMYKHHLYLGTVKGTIVKQHCTKLSVYSYYL